MDAPVAGKAGRKALPFSRRGFSRPRFANLVIARSGSDEAIQHSQLSQLDCFAIARNDEDNDHDHDHDHDHERKGSGTPANALSYARTQAACGAHHGESGLRRPPLAGALACRRSTYGSHQRDFRPEGSASGQASREAA